MNRPRDFLQDVDDGDEMIALPLQVLRALAEACNLLTPSGGSRLLLRSRRRCRRAPLVHQSPKCAR